MIRTIFREANKPEPIEKISQQGFIKWGNNNLYPQFLNGLYYDNPVHGGIIDQKVKFITAGGVDVEGQDKSLLENGNSTYSLQELIDIITLDFEIGNTYCVHFKKNLSTGLWYGNPMDYELIRAVEFENVYLYSEDWSKSRPKFTEIKSIFNVTDEDSECVFVNISRPKQRGFNKSKGLTSNYYPVVNYSGAITDILASIEMSYFTYSEVVNGYKGGTLINLANGVPETTQAEDKIINRIKGEATDRDTQGGMTVTFSDGKERAPEVHQINGNDLDKRYEQAKKSTRDSIMVAHGVISPTLFGVFTDSAFGSNEEMKSAYLLFQDNYVKVRQRNISEPLSWAFNKLNKTKNKIIFNEFLPSILKPEATEASPVRTTLSKEISTDEVLDMFAKVGVSKGSVKLKSSRVYDHSDNEDEFIQSFLSFDTELTDNQKTIITMIGDGESYDSIRKALDIPSRTLSDELIVLGKLGLLDGWKLTNKGESKTVTKAELKVLYSYDLKINAPELVAGGESRPFCKTLVEMDKLYTREDIETIRDAIGRDVWTYRGGWYHNPETKRNTPSCRHTWMQHITVNF